MARPTAIYLSQLLKVIPLAFGFLLCRYSSISQTSLIVNNEAYPSESGIGRLSTDSLPLQLRKSSLAFRQMLLSSLKNASRQFPANLVGDAGREVTAMTSAFSKNPLVFHGASLSAYGLADTSYFAGNEYSFRANYEMTSNWSISGIPLEIGSLQQSWTDHNPNDLLQVAFHFDREKYVAQLKKRMEGKIDPTSLLYSVKDPLENIIGNARKNLVAELKGLNEEFKGQLESEVGHIMVMPNLLTTDIKALKSKFLDPAFISGVMTNQKLLAVLQQRVNNGETVNKNEIDSLQDKVLKLKALQELVRKVEQHKVRWEQSGLITKIKEMAVLRQAGIQNLLNDPSVITKFARQKLSLNGLQRFFLNMNRLDVGQNAVSASPLSFQHFLSKGVNMELLTNKRSIMLMAGKQTDFNSILDFPFSNSPFSTNGIVKAIGIGSGQGTRSATNISIASFSQSMAGISDAMGASMLRQVLVTTVSNRLSIGEKGMMSVELSRSATHYGRGQENDSVGVKSSLSRILSVDNFMANTAISLKYADEFSHQGLSYHVSFNKTSNGYTNPGNSFLSSGGTELGAGLRKSLLNGKLLFAFRGTTRVYQYNDHIDAKWKNTQLLLDARWKMKKGQYIAIRYQPVRMSRQEGQEKYLINELSRFSADASLYRKFGKVSYRNFLTISFQTNRYSPVLVTGIQDRSTTISSFQSLVMGKRVFHININYTDSKNSNPNHVFLNSSVYAEAACSYQLGKHIGLSSGLIYTSIAGWYRQAGFLQTISGQLGEKFSVHLYTDIKKNIRVVQPLWENPVRGDISLRYIIKNNTN